MITLEGMQLPDELMWIDEFEWSDVKATTKQTIQGKFIVQEAKVPSEAGRHITLSSDDSWITRNDVLILQEMTNDTGRQFLLSMHDGRTYLCRFRQWDMPCIDVEMLIQTAYPDVKTQYKITIKLAVA
jgi:hypothetical protein